MAPTHGAPAVPALDHGDEGGQPHRGDQRGGGGAHQARRQRARPGQHPLPPEHADQRPGRQRAEQRLGVGHRQHHAHRRGREQADEQQPGPARPAGHQLAEAGEAVGGHDARDQRDDQAREDEVAAGEPAGGRDDRGVAGEERLRRVRGVVAEGVEHVVRHRVPVAGDRDHPGAVPGVERGGQLAEARHQAEHHDADQAHRDVHPGRGERAPLPDGRGQATGVGRGSSSLGDIGDGRDVGGAGHGRSLLVFRWRGQRTPRRDATRRCRRVTTSRPGANPVT